MHVAVVCIEVSGDLGNNFFDSEIPSMESFEPPLKKVAIELKKAAIEPPPKKAKLTYSVKEELPIKFTCPVVPCVMVEESLLIYASKQGYYCDARAKRKRRHSLPYADKQWFYNSVNGVFSCKKTSRNSGIGCKSILLKAHQHQALKNTKRSTTMLEVEYIVNYRMINGHRYYLVKWVGWPSEANTWEPSYNLNCAALLNEFHDDYNRQLNAFLEERKLTWQQLLSQSNQKKVYQRLYDVTPNNFRFHSTYARAKQQQTLKLKTWQARINYKTKGCPVVAVENEVDLEVLPADFTYVTSNVPGVNVNIPNDPLIGCSCIGGCKKHLEKGNCCPGMHRSKSAYENRLLQIRPGKLIFECNSRCKCGKECPNKVVQRGGQYVVSIYRTANGKGWGVKALEPIPKGAFVTEYVGEVVTNDEAERRGKLYDSNGITYLFDLDYFDSENPLTVDATHMGNISHFINHSCSPNLQVYNVFIDNLDPSLPRIALFARRNININEELTFDYQMTGDTLSNCDNSQEGSNNGDSSSDSGHESNKVDDSSSDISTSSSLKRCRCLCNSAKCRGWLV